MGCFESKPERPPQRPAQQAAISEAPKDPDRATLLNALANMAACIRETNPAAFPTEKETSITIIVIGGAVNTILLQSRMTARGFSFFNPRLEETEYVLVQQAAKYAQLKDPRLQDNWFSNRIVLYIPKTHREVITKEAIEQNEVVYDVPGLKILAAPWPYAICVRLDRVCGGIFGPTESLDLYDAAAYLRRYLQLNQNLGIRRSTIWQWARTYRTQVTDTAIEKLNAVFFERYGQNAIAMDTRSRANTLSFI